MISLTIFKFVLRKSVTAPTALIVGILIPIILLLFRHFLEFGEIGFLNWILMALIWSSFMEGIEILENKQSGVETRIIAAPISWLSYLSSYLAASLTLAALRIVLFLIVGMIIEGWSFSFAFGLFTIYFIFSASTIALSFWFSRMFKNISSATLVLSLTGTLFTMLGGLWFPVQYLTPILNIIAMLSPVYFSVLAIESLVYNGPSYVLLLNLIIVAGFVIIYMLFGSMNRKVF